MTIFGNTRLLQKNGADFGVSKKSNGEGGGDNFGQVRVAKDLDMSYQKRNCTQPGKNTHKKQNEQAQIGATH